MKKTAEEALREKKSGVRSSGSGEDKDALGDRMKRYEAQTERRLMPRLPVVARLDGRAFHSFTKGLERPFDTRLSSAMVETTRFLVRKFAAKVGYTQSDEISLGFYAENGSMIFDGRVDKINTALATAASVFFNNQVQETFPAGYAERMPQFDCRVCNYPSLTEAANAFVWRELDASKNSLSMAARAYYEHKALIGKKAAQLHQLLFEKGINWNDYPTFFKRGTYVQSREVERTFDPVAALAKGVPAFFVEKRLAEGNLPVLRHECAILDTMPPILQVVNRAEVLFFGASPNTCPGNQATDLSSAF